MDDKKFSEFIEVITLADGDYISGFRTGSPNTNIIISKENLLAQLGVKPYAVYSGSITQAGTNDPDVIVNQNELGDDIVWTRDSMGVYYGTLVGAFPADRVERFISGGYGFTTSIERISDDVIRIKTANDGQLTDVSFEIRVYPESES